MMRKQRLFEQEADMLERLYERLSCLLEHKLASSSISINDALDIMHYQQMVWEKLNNCGERSGMDKYYRHEGISVYLSRLDGILSGLDIVWR